MQDRTFNTIQVSMLKGCLRHQTWIPFALIFVATYLSGLYVRNHAYESQTHKEEDNPS